MNTTFLQVLTPEFGDSARASVQDFHQILRRVKVLGYLEYQCLNATTPIFAVFVILNKRYDVQPLFQDKATSYQLPITARSQAKYRGLSVASGFARH